MVKERMKIIAVHGVHLNADGQARLSLTESVARAAGLARKMPDAQLILTGGQTRRGFPTEAVVARQLLPEGLRGRAVRLEKAHSSGDLILELKRYVDGLRKRGIDVDEIVLVISRRHWSWFRIELRATWPEIMPRFRAETVEGDTSLSARLYHICRYVYALIDPHERIILRALKPLMRNAPWPAIAFLAATGSATGLYVFHALLA
jgi:hypothetical protein